MGSTRGSADTKVITIRFNRATAQQKEALEVYETLFKNGETRAGSLPELLVQVLCEFAEVVHLHPAIARNISARQAAKALAELLADDDAPMPKPSRAAQSAVSSPPKVKVSVASEEDEDEDEPLQMDLSLLEK